MIQTPPFIKRNLDEKTKYIFGFEFKRIHVWNELFVPVEFQERNL